MRFAAQSSEAKTIGLWPLSKLEYVIDLATSAIFFAHCNKIGHGHGRYAYVPAECSYDSRLFSMSIVLAIVIPLVALWLIFQFSGRMRRSPWLKTGSALIMGSAIPVMH